MVVKNNKLIEKTRLNTKQQQCFEQIQDFLSQDAEKVFYLFGYAGTGKTYLTGNIIKEILLAKKIDQVIVCAPTHQALNVIESYLRININSIDTSDNNNNNDKYQLMQKIIFMTIHRLLEFKPTIISQTGTKVFKSNKKSKFLKKMENKLVVIDECSMLSQDIVTEINKYIELYPIKIVFLGDSAQLLPVHETHSLIFSQVPKKYKYHIVLDQIMRTKSQDIKDIATSIRFWDLKTTISDPWVTIHNRKSESFKLYHKKEEISNATWFKRFIADTKNNKTPIIITWKNNTADTYNKLIRKHLFQTDIKDSDKKHKDNLNSYIVGDIAMFNNYYMSTESNMPFYTANMIKIMDVETSTKNICCWKNFLYENSNSLAERSFNILVKKFTKINMDYDVNKLIVTKINNDTITTSDKFITVPDKTYFIYAISRNGLDEYRGMLINIQEHIEIFFKKYKSNTAFEY